MDGNVNNVIDKKIDDIVKKNNIFHLYLKVFYNKNSKVLKALLKNGYTSSLYKYIIINNDASLSYFNINLREYISKFYNKIYSLNSNSIYIYDINNHDKLSKYLDDNGRITSQPAFSQCVTYTVDYTVNGETKTITLSSIVPGTIR